MSQEHEIFPLIDFNFKFWGYGRLKLHSFGGRGLTKIGMNSQ